MNGDAGRNLVGRGLEAAGRGVGGAGERENEHTFVQGFVLSHHFMLDLRSLEDGHSNLMKNSPAAHHERFQTDGSFCPELW